MVDDERMALAESLDDQLKLANHGSRPNDSECRNDEILSKKDYLKMKKIIEKSIKLNQSFRRRKRKSSTKCFISIDNTNAHGRSNKKTKQNENEWKRVL